MRILKLKPLVLTMAAFAYSLCTLQAALADDTEIYIPKHIQADQQVRPNILFILDSSGSMRETVKGSGSKNRNTVMHEVVNGLIDSLKGGDNVNVGFMRYGGAEEKRSWRDPYYWVWENSNEHGGHVVFPVTHLSDDAVAKKMKDVVKTVNTSDWTPLLETYYEAYLYFTGQAPNFSGNRNHENSVQNDKFVSPINHSCQANHIIYITDGEPTRDVDANELVNTLVAGKKYTTPCETGKNSDGACLSQLAAYMANEDMAPALPIKQTITSHFIGFAIDKPFLSEAASAGGGQYLTSDNASGLADALQSIIVDITAQNSTFVAPSVAVSAYNNLGFRNDLYYALFRPSEGTRWPGNIKKYKLKTQDNDGKAIDPIIIDSANKSAIDDDTGFFKDSASSFWNNIVDGSDISKGGAAARLKDRTDRKIYTWHGADKVAGSAGTAAVLNDFKTSVSATNSKITNAMLDVSGGAARTNVVNWITQNSGRMGDILHNEPRLVAYKTDEDLARANTINSQEELVMFAGSNEGFIHAIDPKNGNELYSFIPKELLHLPGKYLADNKAGSNKAYGMDGLISIWSEYGAAGSNSTKSVEKVNLYAGMRRGGSNYYALDVTEKENPKLKWVIKGAYNPESQITKGFEKLGLTFSAPKLADIKISDTKTKVLIFSGGYDKEHDLKYNNIGEQSSENIPKDDTLGNALYIVNAETGALLWSAGGSNSNANLKLASMTNSMPATPSVVDRNGDGLADIIYASDLRGQIFRFDIDNSKTTLDSAVTGTRLAQLAGAGADSNRRFFNSPDVALIRDSGKKPYFTISIGSGFRESPLNEQTDDRFYVIRDNYVDGKRPNELITESKLTDISATAASNADTAAFYTEITKLENKIKQLNANVASAQDAYVQHKIDIGYTEAYDKYLALYSQSNQLQKEIDMLTNSAYDTFDPANLEDGKPYNPVFLQHHATETVAQHKLQSTVVNMQKALNILNSEDSFSTYAQSLADLYNGLLLAQEATEQKENRFIEQENFILKGNLNPSWTPELIEQTGLMYPGVVFETTGDFSDSAGDFTDYIKQNRLDYLSDPVYIQRENLNEQQVSISAVLDALVDSSTIDKAALLADLTTQFAGVGIEPVSSNISTLLDLDELSKQQVLNDDLANYVTINNSIAQKTAELLTTQAAAQAALELSDEIAASNGDFDAKQQDIDAAYTAASDPTTGISALRAQMNTQYANLDVANGTISSAQIESLKTSDGFYLRLVRGEKVLSDSISFRGAVLFSTFTPRGETISVCGSDVGTGKAYALSLRDSKGMFVKEVNGAEVPIRSLQLKRPGIPPAPSVIVTSNGPVVIVGTEILDIEAGVPVTATHWREK